MEKWKEIRSQAFRKRKPDFFAFSEAGFGGGQNGWVVGVYQPEPNPVDAWNQPVSVDRLNIGLPEGTSYKSALPALFVGGSLPSFVPPADLDKLKDCCPADYEFVKKALNREYDFYVLTQDEQERIMSELGVYYEMDINDVANTPAIAAIYPCGERDDTPDPDWNKRVRYERRRERILSRRQEQSKVLSDISKSSLIGLRLAYEEDAFGYNVGVKYDGRVFRSVEEAERYQAELLAREEARKEAERCFNAQRAGDLPVAYYHNPDIGRVYVSLNHGVLTIPESCFGSAIGKNGAKIKAAERHFGCRITLKVDINVDKAWGFNWRIIKNKLY